MTLGRLARAATVVALLGLVSRLLGYVREAVLAGTFGASAETDAFAVSLLIVNSVAAVLLYTLVTLVIPTFQRERADHGEASAWRLVAAMGAWVGILLIALSCLAALWPEGPAALFAFEGERAELTEDLIRIMAPALALQGFSALFTAMLQIYGRFAGPAAVGIAFNFGIIAAIAIGQGAIGIQAAGIGVAVGALLQVALQLPQFRRLLREAEVRPALVHPRLTGMAALALPVLGASTLQQVNNFTDKLFAATLEEGRVAALGFANALGQAPRAALLLPMMTPLFPLIARMMAERRERDALTAFSRAAGLIALVGIPASLLISLWARELTELAFGRGSCGEDCVTQTAAPLVFYGLAVWGGFFSYLLNRTLSAANLQRRIIVATVITVAVTIALDFALIGPLEQAGLALAAAIGIYVNVVILLVYARRRFPALDLRALALQNGRVLVAAGAAVVVAALLGLALPTGEDGALAVAGPFTLKLAAALAVFLVAARLVAPGELAEGRRALAALRPGRRARG